MTAKHSIEFFSELKDLSEMSLMLSLNNLVDKGDLASVANAAQMLAEKGSFVLEEDLGYDTKDGPDSKAVSSLSYAYIFAKALGPRRGQALDRTEPMSARLWDVQLGQATIDYAMPPLGKLDADQQKIFEHILPMYVNSKNQSAPAGRSALSGLFSEVVQHITAPEVIDRILEAGANPSVKGTIRHDTGNASFMSAIKLAMMSGNVHAVMSIAKSSDDEVEMDIGMLAVDADAGAKSSTNPAKAIATMMTLQGRNYSGLNTLAAIESVTKALPLDAIELRCKVLNAYLQESAQRRIGWDPLQVVWVLGHPATEAGMPAQTKGISPKAWTQTRDHPINELITVALQTHCHPILSVLSEKLVRFHSTAVLPVAFTPNNKTARQGGVDSKPGFTHLTALGLMVHPINVDFGVQKDNFEQTVELLERLDLVKDDRIDNRSSRPALHTAVREMGNQAGWALTRLLDLGIPAELKNQGGRKATHGLPADQQDAWNTIVRSYKARSAATDAIQDIRQELGI